MSFLNITQFQHTSINDEVLMFSYLSSNKLQLETNKQYKVDVLKLKKIQSNTNYTLSVNNNCISHATSKHPQKALTLSLSSGTYRIVFSKNGIYNKLEKSFNVPLMSSKGKIILNEFQIINEDNIFNQDNSLNYDNILTKQLNQFQFKMTKGGKFSLWIQSQDQSNLLGQVEICLVKISEKTFQYEVNSYLFTNSNYSSLMLTLSKNYLYQFQISVLQEINILKPSEKYPAGNYQISMSSTIGSSKSSQIINSMKNSDKKKFNISFGKLENLTNIGIPSNLNPMNYYIMLGKFQFLLYFDFIANSYYFQPCTAAECFMALYVPESKCESVLSSKNYSIFKITSYKLIHQNYKDTDQIKQNFKNWLSINTVFEDQYQLFFWGNIENNDEEFFYLQASKFIQIQKYFSYVQLNIEGFVYDDVSQRITQDDVLDYSISTCNFNILQQKQTQFNHIDWSSQNNWKNYQQKNKLYDKISGSGIFKITKQQFLNVTGIDLNSVSSGTLTKQNLIDLHINQPMISPYNRFQYWLRTQKF